MKRKKRKIKRGRELQKQTAVREAKLRGIARALASFSLKRGSNPYDVCKQGTCFWSWISGWQEGVGKFRSEGFKRDITRRLRDSN